MILLYSACVCICRFLLPHTCMNVCMYLDKFVCRYVCVDVGKDMKFAIVIFSALGDGFEDKGLVDEQDDVRQSFVF